MTALIGESQSRPSAHAGLGAPGLGDRPRSPARRWLIWTCLTSLLVVLGLAGLALLARAEFGSIPSALSYLRGARLIPLRYSVPAGTVVRGEERILEFKLKNWSDKPIVILGAKSSCTCVSLGDFPIRVPSGGTNNLGVRLRTKKRKPGPISERMRIYTDEKRSHGLTLAVTGVVR
ncbi:MAG: DUF1573 domain-containing protein [Isosphaeraceae bacterium]